MLKKNKKTIFNKFSKIFNLGIVGNKNKILFINNLALMLKSGLQITEALNILGEDASGRWKKIIIKLATSVASGNTLLVSFEQYPEIFPAILLSAIRAGEASGNLEENLFNVSQQLKRSMDIKQKIRNAMIYPSIVLLVSLTLGMIIALWVLPKITPLFSGLNIELPLSTRVLIYFSELVESRGSIILVALLIFVMIFIWLLRSKFFKPISHLFILYMPIVKKMSRSKNLALFSQTLRSLLKSGLSIDESLAITRHGLNNYYYKKSIEEISAKIVSGMQLSKAFGTYSRLFPKMMVSLLGVGERSGNIEEELENIANYYSNELEQDSKLLSTIFEPLLLLIIGLLVAGLAISIITPIYQITGNIYG